ncbi:unnamed protein product [Clavelina lepadiformis]|uniref:Uncharacterized protein n=1 Tax=Clavelina lepadiformis TaxID=159417 RepID=A0ABP0FZF7_CLALP
MLWLTAGFIYDEFFYPPPKFELGESFSSFLSTFESFCDSVDATAAAQKHTFMLNLPEEVKLEMKCNGAECSAQDLKDCPSNVRFLGASGTVIAMAGKSKLNFTVAGTEATRDVFVSSESCILGLDFL